MTGKKLLTIFVVILFLSILIPWLNGYLEYGKLDITTNSKLNTISITPLFGSIQNSSSIINAHGSFFGRLKKGGYLVTTTLGSNSTSQHLIVQAHHVTNIYMNVINTGGVEPVAYSGGAADISADSSRLVYVVPGGSGLTEINSQNQESTIDSAYSFQSVSWASPSFGVGEDSSKNLYAIKDGVVDELSLPQSNQGRSSLAYAVAPNNTIYVAVGHFVYSSNNFGKTFKKIYSDRQAGTVLVAGTNIVSIINSGYNNSTANIVTMVGPTVIKQQLQTFVNAYSSWSPGGTYIVISGSSAGEVLNSSLRQVATIPQSNFTNPVWLNNNTLFYSTDDQLWSYNVRDQKAHVIATAPLGETIQELDVSADKSYIYMISSVAGEQGMLAIRRVGLQGQKIPAIIYNLQDILPQSTPGAGYSLGLVNFSGEPVVQVVAAGGSTASAALSAAQQELQGDGFNLSDLKFSVIQSD
jgi:hypothetical protein